jgi:hypothetical protein
MLVAVDAARTTRLTAGPAGRATRDVPLRSLVALRSIPLPRGLPPTPLALGLNLFFATLILVKLG